MTAPDTCLMAPTKNSSNGASPDRFILRILVLQEVATDVVDADQPALPCRPDFTAILA